MMTTDTIAQLVQANGGAAVLDRIHLPYADPKAGPAAKFGLGAELYLPDIDRSLLREHAAEFLYEFWSMFPDQVNEFLQRDTKRAKRFKGDPRAAIEADIANYAAETGYSGALFGRVDIGLPNDDVPPTRQICSSTELGIRDCPSSMQTCPSPLHRDSCTLRCCSNVSWAGANASDRFMARQVLQSSSVQAWGKTASTLYSS